MTVSHVIMQVNANQAVTQNIIKAGGKTGHWGAPEAENRASGTLAAAGGYVF